MENQPLPESVETKEITARIITSQDLMELIYKGGPIPQDERFLPVDEGGVFKYFFLSELIKHRQTEDKLFYPAIEAGGEVAALSELERDPYTPNNFWIKFISVDPKYQGKGYASELVRKIFEFAKEHEYSLEPSYYSEEGLERLKNVIERTQQETGVPIIDKHIR